MAVSGVTTQKLIILAHQLIELANAIDRSNVPEYLKIKAMKARMVLEFIKEPVEKNQKE